MMSQNDESEVPHLHDLVVLLYDLPARLAVEVLERGQHAKRAVELFHRSHEHLALELDIVRDT